MALPITLVAVSARLERIQSLENPPEFPFKTKPPPDFITVSSLAEECLHFARKASEGSMIQIFHSQDQEIPEEIQRNNVILPFESVMQVLEYLRTKLKCSAYVFVREEALEEMDRAELSNPIECGPLTSYIVGQNEISLTEQFKEILRLTVSNLEDSDDKENILFNLLNSLREKTNSVNKYTSGDLSFTEKTSQIDKINRKIDGIAEFVRKFEDEVSERFDSERNQYGQAEIKQFYFKDDEYWLLKVDNTGNTPINNLEIWHAETKRLLTTFCVIEEHSQIYRKIHLPYDEGLYFTHLVAVQDGIVNSEYFTIFPIEIKKVQINNQSYYLTIANRSKKGYSNLAVVSPQNIKKYLIKTEIDYEDETICPVHNSSPQAEFYILSGIKVVSNCWSNH